MPCTPSFLTRGIKLLNTIPRRHLSQAKQGDVKMTSKSQEKRLISSAILSDIILNFSIPNGRHMAQYQPHAGSIVTPSD